MKCCHFLVDLIKWSYLSDLLLLSWGIRCFLGLYSSLLYFLIVQLLLLLVRKFISIPEVCHFFVVHGFRVSWLSLSSEVFWYEWKFLIFQFTVDMVLVFFYLEDGYEFLLEVYFFVICWCIVVSSSLCGNSWQLSRLSPWFYLMIVVFSYSMIRGRFVVLNGHHRSCWIIVASFPVENCVVDSSLEHWVWGQECGI
jgi:hypothetical protein